MINCINNLIISIKKLAGFFLSFPNSNGPKQDVRRERDLQAFSNVHLTSQVHLLWLQTHTEKKRRERKKRGIKSIAFI